MIGTIALCGVPARIAQALEQCGEYYILRFGDEPERRGDVKLAYFLRDGTVVDLAVVGYPGAAGLTACDYLRWQNKQMSILWLCDRTEFEPEAQDMNVSFYRTGPPETDQIAHTEPIEQTAQTAPTDQTDQMGQILQTEQTEQTIQTVQIILNAINKKDHEGGTI